MFVTAHRVRSSDGLEAIHSYLHSHGPVDWPGDVSTWPESNPGELRLNKTTLPVGGHRVRSYLDVIAPDDTSSERIAKVIGGLAQDLEERRNPTVYREGAVTLRFGTELELDAIRPDELRALADHAQSLLESYVAMAGG